MKFDHQKKSLNTYWSVCLWFTFILPHSDPGGWCLGNFGTFNNNIIWKEFGVHNLKKLSTNFKRLHCIFDVKFSCEKSEWFFVNLYWLISLVRKTLIEKYNHVICQWMERELACCWLKDFMTLSTSTNLKRLNELFQWSTSMTYVRLSQGACCWLKLWKPCSHLYSQTL